MLGPGEDADHLPPRPVSYRPLLGEQVLRQMSGLPAEGFDLLVQVLARICEDPYDRLFSRAIRADDPTRRMAEIGDFGFVEFLVDDAAGLVRVADPRLGMAERREQDHPDMRMNYALSRTSACGGPRTTSSLSTGQRQAASRTRPRRPGPPAVARDTGRVPGGLVLPRAGPASSPGPACTALPARAAGRPRRSTRRRRQGWRHRGASRRGRARRARARPGPAARPTSPTRLSRAALATSAPRASVPSSTWWTSPAVPPRTRNTGWIASTRPARRRRQRTLLGVGGPGSGARSGPPGPSAAVIPGRSAGQARRGACPGPGTPSGGSEPSAGPGSWCRTRHARAADHRRLAEREQHQADGDSAAAPPPDPLGVLEPRSRIAVSHCRISPYSADQADSSAGGRDAEVASGPVAYVFLPARSADRIFAIRRAGAGRGGRARSAARTARRGPSRRRRRRPARTSASCQPRAAAAARTAIRASLRPG